MRKVTAATLTVLLSGCQPDTAQTSRKMPREVEFAQEVIVSSWALALSPSAQAGRNRCGDACPESGTVEMGIGMLGVGGATTTDALMNLVAVRFDADATEEMQCQFVQRGQGIIPRLKQLNVAEASSWCGKTFEKAQRQLPVLKDLQVQSVCRTPEQVDEERNELIKMIIATEGPAEGCED